MRAWRTTCHVESASRISPRRRRPRQPLGRRDRLADHRDRPVRRPRRRPRPCRRRSARRGRTAALRSLAAPPRRAPRAARRPRARPGCRRRPRRRRCAARRRCPVAARRPREPRRGSARARARSDSGSRPAAVRGRAARQTHVTQRRASGATDAATRPAAERLGDVLAQDRRLERAQVRRRLDAEPVDERAARVAVGRERVGLAAGAVEREHLLAAQPLAQRMLAHERLELARDLGVPPAREVGVDAVAQAGEPQILQPRDLGLGEALVGDVRERRAAPQRERLAQRRRRLPRLAAGELARAASRSAPRSARRRARPAARAARSRRPRRRTRSSPSAARSRDATTCTAFRACCGPSPSHSSSTTRSTGTIAPRCTSSSASSESVRPRGTRRAGHPPASTSIGPRIRNRLMHLGREPIPRGSRGKAIVKAGWWRACADADRRSWPR